MLDKQMKSFVHVACCRMEGAASEAGEEELRELREAFSFRDTHRCLLNKSSTDEPQQLPEQSKGQTIMPLPSSTTLLDSQIAGHRHGEGRTKLGMLRHADGSILKPLVPNDKRARCEHDFFLLLEKHRKQCPDSCADDILHELATLVPVYLGVFEAHYPGDDESKPRISYMKLEDLCRDFKHPCIADIKIGRQAYDPDASEEKIELSKKRYPVMSDIGYRILGMRVYEEDGGVKIYDGEWGVQQTEKSIPNAIKSFMAANAAQCTKLIVKELEKVLEWFKRQRTFKFYSSSLLFVYDAYEAKCTVKMIDFAHVFPANGTVDDSYTYGLERLMDHFRMVESSIQ